MSHLSTNEKATDTAAFSSSNTGQYYHVGELLCDPTSAVGAEPFDSTNLKTLVNMIYGANGELDVQITSLKTSTATTPLTSANLRANTYNKAADQSLVVRLGGLDWMVTYVSNDDDGNLIATLWLTNNHQDAWANMNVNLGAHYGIANGGLYSDWSSDWSSSSVSSTTYPCNMYGTSYIRVETLNNPSNRQYASNTSTLVYGTTQSSDHIFSLYTVASKGLTEYLTKPNQIPWMVNLQRPQYEGMYTDAYYYTNDSLTTENAYNYAGTQGSNSEYYVGKTSYSNWGDDYLWLPSAGEVGNGYRVGGIWRVTEIECKTNDGSTNSFATGYIGSTQSNQAGTAYCYTLKRTASGSSNCGRIYPSGTIYTSESVSCSQAVRPVLALSLSSAASNRSQPHQISFNQQSGTGGATSVTAMRGDTLVSVSVPTRLGYVFAGYYTSENGQGTKIYNANGTPAVTASPFTANTTLYARWTPITYTVQYLANGGSGSTASSSHTYGVASNLTANAFSRAGYTFAGWATSSSGAVAYADGASVTGLTTTNGAMVNLYAVWQLATVTVTFDNQSATTAGTAQVSVANAAAFPNITPPSRTGYTFGGYYTEPQGGGQKIYNADGMPAVTKSTFLLDTTLYAYWLWYDVKSVAGSTTSLSIEATIDKVQRNATMMIFPASGHRVTEFSFDNVTWFAVAKCQELLTNLPIAITVQYSANESLNSLLINFNGLATHNVVPIYLKTASGAYSGLKSAGGSVSGVVVTATLGGTAYIVGDDFENLEDSDTITISTTLCQPGYAFVGWYLDDDRTTAISTTTSYRVTKAEALGHTLVAVYQPTSNNSVNLETDNT